MKIGIVCYPTFGGSGVVATELGKALADKGHEIHFITYSQPVRLGGFRKNIRYHEVNVSDYPLFLYPPYELVLASKMIDVARYEKLDLIHAHYAIPHASAAYTAKQVLAEEGIHIPVITTLHGTDITLLGKDTSFEPVITFAINKSDAVTAVSHSLRNDTYKLFGVNKEIEVIPNFINFDMLEFKRRDEMRAEYSPNGEKILVHISNFRPVKRVTDVVEIFARIKDQVNATLLLVGDGPDRFRCEQMCRELNICDRVIFLGMVKNPLEVLAVADLFLLPSESESFGLAALEAMAMGVPVITTNTGGLPELNRHGVTGMMSDMGDVEDMAKHALSLLTDDKLLEKFKQNALTRAKDFSIDRILPLYEKVYNSVLQTA
ncbi:MAG: N-acetyl-alpha-D-glucosaminyl L-malate synthase BshA [Flavobacteriales bacterium]|mgnify:CR=1 FL=1|nr:N-acetyl-alpha-D-glucosaminyl L-malate synthase BshA [Flavobacteriales bacterium]